MSGPSFSLLRPMGILASRWKTVAGFVILAAIISAVTVFIVPRYYKSAATLVSANPVLADKARFFNNNIQGLYSYFGSGDDLDRIQGIAEMDTVFYQLVDSFHLVSYYHLQGNDPLVLRRKAMLSLRDDLHFEKTEQGQLRIIAWTKDPVLSANLVNSLTASVKNIQAGIWKDNYAQAADQLSKSIALLEQQYRTLADSSKDYAALTETRRQTVLAQIRQYSTSRDEFVLASQAPPAVFYVLEPATPAVVAQRPDKPMIILAACFVAFIFGCIWLLVSHRTTAPDVQP